MTLKEALSAIYIRRWVLFSTIGLIVPIGLIFVFMQPPVYSAAVVILVEKPSLPMPNPGYSKTVTPDTDGDAFYNTQYEIINSKLLADRAMDALKKASPKEFKNVTMGKISTELVPKTHLVRIRVDYKDPAIAAKMANTLADLYIKYYTESMPASLLDQKLAIETEINGLGRRYKAKHPKILVLKEKVNLINDRLEALKIGPSGKMQLDNIELVIQAVPPKKPIGPKRTPGILYSLFCSVALGIGIIFLIEFFNKPAASR